MTATAEDKRIHSDVLATADFFLSWEKNGVRHTDGYHAPRVNFWRDILPDEMRSRLEGSRAGDRVECPIPEGRLVLANSKRGVHRLRRRHLGKTLPDGRPFRPKIGRFYPQGLLRGVAGVFQGNLAPFRCLDMDETSMLADVNHPLAGVDLHFSARVHDVREKFEEHGGTSIDWFETVATGPGMQARAFGKETDFFHDGAFLRSDPTEDSRFYHSPRMVQHIDDTAGQLIRSLYGDLLVGRDRILDLMASWHSHLPDGLSSRRVEGLGMNPDELGANPRLDAFTVHDLNKDPRLPYGNGLFDAVICSLSIEYLIRPMDVVAEVRRVLRPGGLFALTFSDRWFPTKAIGLWSDLHPFERMGFVLELLLRDGGFGSMESFSIQGYPRPDGDKYAHQRATSDPVFAVWGTTSE